MPSLGHEGDEGREDSRIVVLAWLYCRVVIE